MPSSFSTSVYNFSSYCLTPGQLRLLQRGPNFLPDNYKIDENKCKMEIEQLNQNILNSKYVPDSLLPLKEYTESFCKKRSNYVSNLSHEEKTALKELREL